VRLERESCFSGGPSHGGHGMNSAYSVRRINRWNPKQTVAILIGSDAQGGRMQRLTITACLPGVISGASEIEEGGGTIWISGQPGILLPAPPPACRSRAETNHGGREPEPEHR
jgi:hypothetical protein